jgi:TPR repeat protein
MTATMTNTTTTKTPSVSPLYFTDTATSQNNNNNTNFSVLPVELLTKCLVDYASWGDLAKLACVQKSFSFLVEDAAAGHDSKWELAQAMLDGTLGLAVNVPRAMTLLHELAGVTLIEGSSSSSDDAFVCQLNDSTAFAPAMKRLATCYLEQEDTHECPDNTEMGLAWLQGAYELGNDVNAAHELALHYEYGTDGTTTDVYQAATWFQKAAMGGHVEAMAEYAMCCELGCGREANDEDAMEWYMRAAQEGHVTANFSVGEAFEEARGVPQSDADACLWYYKAAVKGDEGSKQALRRLADIARIVVPGVGALLQQEVEL